MIVTSTRTLTFRVRVGSTGRENLLYTVSSLLLSEGLFWRSKVKLGLVKEFKIFPDVWTVWRKFKP